MSANRSPGEARVRRKRGVVVDAGSAGEESKDEQKIEGRRIIEENMKKNLTNIYNHIE